MGTSDWIVRAANKGIKFLVSGIVYAVALNAMYLGVEEREDIHNNLDDEQKRRSLFATSSFHLTNRTPCYYVLSAMLTAITCKILKFLLAVKRPTGAAKTDPGMPSSHATMMGFLSFLPYVAHSVHRCNLVHAITFGSLGSYSSSIWINQALAVAVIVFGLLLAALRVVGGYHTLAQVLVGYTLGFSCLLLSVWAEDQLLPDADQRLGRRRVDRVLEVSFWAISFVWAVKLLKDIRHGDL